MDPTPSLRAIDRYLDAAPRTAARTEELGPFTLFVNEGGGWRYYARPTPDRTDVTSAAVGVVRARQRALRQPEQIEWIVDLVPEVGPAAERAGLAVTERPLMQLLPDRFVAAAAPGGVDVSIVRPDDDVRTFSAVAEAAFGSPGTKEGPADPEALRKAERDVDEDIVRFTRERLRRGFTVTAVAHMDGAPIAVGSHQPLDRVTEVVGVGCLPAFRRRGVAAALTSLLVRDAFERRVGLVVLSADDDAVARIYARVGFRRMGMVGEARLPV